MRWAQIARYNVAERFVSLSDGKQPLFIWLSMYLIPHVSDPLLAGRIVSVIAGLVTIIGLLCVSYELFQNKWIGLLSAVGYSVLPLAYILDRLALYDSLVATFSIWTLYFTIRLVKKITLGGLFLLAHSIAASMLTKSSGLLNIILVPLTYPLFVFRLRKNKEYIKWLVYAGLSLALAHLYYSVLKLSPFYGRIAEKNSIFVYPFSELTIPIIINSILQNLPLLATWLVQYMSVPVLLAAFFALFVSSEYRNEKLVLLLWGFVPFFGLVVLGKTLYPRYLLFMTLPFLILSAYSMAFILRKLKTHSYLFSLILLVFFGFNMYTSVRFFINPALAPIPQKDIFQYATGWPSGKGMREIAQTLQKKSETEPITVLSEGIYGSLATTSLELYLGNNTNTTIRAIEPIPETVEGDLAKEVQTKPVYLLLNRSLPPDNWNLELVEKYDRQDDVPLALYQLIP